LRRRRRCVLGLKVDLLCVYKMLFNYADADSANLRRGCSCFIPGCL